MRSIGNGCSPVVPVLAPALESDQSSPHSRSVIFLPAWDWKRSALERSHGASDRPEDAPPTYAPQYSRASGDSGRGELAGAGADVDTGGTVVGAARSGGASGL